ncbi:hypothetical protein [Gordonia paraffinivorans]|uniref:hypothetical protein n=1 Tax=Gordonia paraffinivorans TaxID=175628 RepID=UPI001445D303|nr:hypothetical protein [Gordonia paraffinivorans]
MKAEIERSVIGFDERGGLGVRDCLNSLETIARASYCLLAGLVHTESETVPRIGAKQGYGIYLGLLNDLRPKLPNRLQFIVDEQLEVADVNLGSRTLREWRNLLSHGGVTPRDGHPFRHSELVGIIDRLITSFNKYFSDWDLLEDSASEFVRVAFAGSDFLNPLLTVDGKSWGFLHSYDLGMSPRITYFLLNRSTGEKRIDLTNQFEVDLAQNFIEKGARTRRAREIGLFREAVRADVVPFADGGRVGFDVDSNRTPFVVTWRRRAGESIEERTDVFDISAGDGTRRWRSEEGEFQSYRMFIRDISKWGVLHVRLLEQARAADENEISHSQSLLRPVSGYYPRRREVRLAPGASGESSASDSLDVAQDRFNIEQLERELDSAAARLTGSPQLFFLSGEAGLGKTRTLIDVSLRRSELLAKEGADDKPAYVYVDLARTQLSSLPRAIDSVLSGTFILNADRAFALCRNGLLVFLVDGFDELVGGAGYTDAFGALEGTLKKLGHSGTILIAARSSYRANQYQESLNRALVADAEVVHHELLELQPWSREQVNHLFEKRQAWAAAKPYVSEDEIGLLGIPYFARVFDDILANHGVERLLTIDLVDLLLDAYLDRESAKLSGVSWPGAEPVSKDRLRVLLAETAHQMQVENHSTLSEPEFLELAEMVLEIDPSDRERYRDAINRMSVLCGVAVESSSTADRTKEFGFDHEIYRDSLAARWLADELSRIYGSGALRKADKILERELSHVQLSPTMARSIVKGVDKVHLSETLSVLTGHGYQRGSAISRNIGLMVEEYLAQNGRLGPIADCLEIGFERLTVRGEIGSITLRDCVVEELIVYPGETQGTLQIESADIQGLVIAGLQKEVQEFDAVVSGEVQISELREVDADEKVQKLHSSRRDIFEVLSACNWRGAKDVFDALSETAESEDSRFAERVLRWLNARTRRSVIVLEATNIPGDTAGRGVPEPFNDSWASFVAAAVQSGVAQRNRINAAGPQKSRVTFIVEPSDVLRRKADNESVGIFWQVLR